jgi:two-component system LytT family response regulator
LLLQTFEGVRVLSIAHTVKDAVQTIDKLKPNLVFLDVMLPDGNGFDVLKQIKYENLKVIFTTSYAEFAIRAFEISALHYLLKPITVEMLEDALNRFKKVDENWQSKTKLQLAESSFNNQVDRIMLPTIAGQEVFNLKDIVRVESEQNYSKFIFTNKTSLIVSKNLKHFENLLTDFGFCRVHNRYLVNIEHIKKFQKGRFASITMSDIFEISITENKKDELQNSLGKRIIQI